MAPGVNLSVSLKDSALFAMSGSLAIRPALPSFCLKMHGMRKTLAMIWTEDTSVERRFALKWLVDRIGEEELPE